MYSTSTVYNINLVVYVLYYTYLYNVKIILVALVMTILLRKPPKDDEEVADSRNKQIVPCGIVALPCHPHRRMYTRRARSLFNRPPHRAALALDAYRSGLNARMNRLLWDLVSSAAFVGVLLATAYVMREGRTLEQNLMWHALLVADRQTSLNVVRVHVLVHYLSHPIICSLVIRVQ